MDSVLTTLVRKHKTGQIDTNEYWRCVVKVTRDRDLCTGKYPFVHIFKPIDIYVFPHMWYTYCALRVIETPYKTNENCCLISNLYIF